MKASNRIKTVLIKALLLSVFLFINMSCLDSETDDETTTVGNWITAVDFEGQYRAGAVSFVINNKAFVGLGKNSNEYFNDFYSFNEQDGYWEDIADFPGEPRENAVTFVIGNKAYVGLGYNYDLNTEELNDFWEYDSETNVWTQLSNFPSARYGSVAFAIDGYGYVGTGNDGKYFLSDFYKYDPDSDEWNEVRGFSGGKRENAVAVVLNGEAYVFGGRNNGSYKADIWKYTPTENTWTDLTPDSDNTYYDEFTAAVSRYYTVALAIQNRIIVTTGLSGSSSSLDYSSYEYTPSTQVWEKKTSFEGSGRSRAVGSSYWDNMFEFLPDEDYDDED
jgi:N-acetylneuraminic acid mutarotase